MRCGRLLQDIQFGAPLPLLGIAAQVGGYTVMEAREDLMSCRVTEGLTEDAVSARLHEGMPTTLAALNQVAKSNPQILRTRDPSIPTLQSLRCPQLPLCNAAQLRL